MEQRTEEDERMFEQLLSLECSDVNLRPISKPMLDASSSRVASLIYSEYGDKLTRDDVKTLLSWHVDCRFATHLICEWYQLMVSELSDAR